MVPDGTGCHTSLWLPNLPHTLWDLISQVPPGRVTTYGLLAEALGDKAAARWIGEYLAHHEAALYRAAGSGSQFLSECPCYRVVRADGSLGLYAHGDPAHKAELLRRENVDICGGKVDLARYAFRPAVAGTRPLERLKFLQEELAHAVRQRALPALPKSVAAVDVAYRGEEAFGVYTLTDAAGERILWENTMRQKAEFPYISGFLAFRELPVLIRLIAQARSADKLGDVILVDGSGIVHPRGVGIASHLGVLCGVPTVGVTKTLLCGTLEPEAQHPWITHWICRGSEKVGFAFRPSARSKDLLYVSPGHLVDLSACQAVVEPLRRGRRLPEPLYWADRRSKQLARTGSRE